MRCLALQCLGLGLLAWVGLGVLTAFGQAPLVPLSSETTTSPGADSPEFAEVLANLRRMQSEIELLRTQLDVASRSPSDAAAAVSTAVGPADAATPGTLVEARPVSLGSAPVPVPPVKYPTIAINGVFQADVGFFDQDPVNRATVGNAVDGAHFRRARLSAKGSVTETVNYFMQMDFAFFGRPTFTDLWIDQTDVPLLGNVRIGQWKQPFSLEVVSSFRYTTFMERSLLFTSFTPFRHLGIGFYDHADDLRMTWAASGIRTGQDQFGGSASNGGGWGTVERVTWLPWYDEASNGRSYLHLGLAHFFSTPQDRINNFRTIPELYIGQQNAVANGNQQPIPGNLSGTPVFLQTGNLKMNAYNVFGVEKLWVAGPLSWQTEAMVNVVDRVEGPVVVLPGFYTQVGYFLTGEHRPYDRKAGAIDRVIPHENFFRVRTDRGPVTGLGAWEVAFRVSYLDFHAVDQVVAPNTGGDLLDTTVGLNWYWNPYTKVAANWVHSFLNNPLNGRSECDGFALRAQIDF